ncbi:hypothetical protein TTHERM_00666270 (macronuclear) [Tetrahymena thermophila SB210]|uniref:Uncharacterized protein n=1 Tax=Tetrahymena thermophila (strain SB210) TaxID=312017 RepID=Q23TF5_TETTS|nr:hypothetical protein TTHERM_00666270 [Tetrahymena thermophila SB210]EAR99751.2 hypothetical protein TTHERM_00666270 [Tetrahymena thermophila SB210]|eukprot:XP_001019996.2 hypothetical protein TTHERM_00666270 [Tetrahymena thermophila SB210]
MNRYQQEDNIRLSQHQHTFGVSNSKSHNDQTQYQNVQHYKPSTIHNQGYDQLNEEPFSIRQILMRLDHLESQAKNQEALQQKVYSLDQELQQLKRQDNKYEKLNQQIESVKSAFEGKILIFDEKIVALSSRVDTKLNAFLNKIQEEFPKATDISRNQIENLHNSKEDKLKQNDYFDEINNLYKLVRKNLQAQKELFEELNLIKKALINNNILNNVSSKTTPKKNEIMIQQNQQTPQTQSIDHAQMSQYKNPIQVSQHKDNNIHFNQNYQQNMNKQERIPEKSFAKSTDNYYNKKAQNISPNQKNSNNNRSVLIESDIKYNNNRQQPEHNQPIKIEDELMNSQEFDIINFKKSKKGSIDYSIKYNDKSDKKRDTLSLSQSLPKSKLNLNGTYQSSYFDNTQEIQKIEKQSLTEFEERKRKIDEEINRRIQLENARREQVIIQDKENTSKIQEKQQKEQFKNTPLGTEKSREKEILNRLNLERRMKDEKIQLYSGIQKQNNNNQLQSNQYQNQPQQYFQSSLQNNNSNPNYSQDFKEMRDSKSPFRMKTLQ